MIQQTKTHQENVDPHLHINIIAQEVLLKLRVIGLDLSLQVHGTHRH
jgi:hypothetical protein